MPRIPTYQREVGMETQSPRALASPSAASAGYATEPFRQLANLGQAVSGLGELLAKMHKDDVETELLNRETDFTTALTTLNNQFGDPAFVKDRYGDGTYTNERGEVITKRPFSQYAEDYRTKAYDLLNEEVKRFKVAGGQDRDLFLRAGQATIEKFTGKVVNHQYELIQEGYRVAAHKQFLATEADFERIVLSGVDPDTAQQVLEQGLALTQTTGERADLDPLTIAKMQDELRSSFQQAAKNTYRQAVDRGDIEGAQNGLDLLLRARGIDPADHKQQSDELPVTIELTRASRAFLAGDAQGAQQIIEGIPTAGLSTEQLSERAKLLRLAKEQAQTTQDANAAAIFRDLYANNKAEPTVKAQVADKARQQIAASDMKDSEKRAMWSFVGSWEEGKGVKTNWQRLSSLSTGIAGLNDLSSGEDFHRWRRELVQAAIDGEISPDDFGKLDDRLTNTLPVSQSSALKRGVEYVMQHRLLGATETSADREKPGFEQAIYLWVKQQQAAGKTVGGQEVYVHARELAAMWQTMTAEQRKAVLEPPEEAATSQPSEETKASHRPFRNKTTGAIEMFELRNGKWERVE